jgi:DNA-binding response OmpR family regulator
MQKVLVVEDDAVMRAIEVRELKKLGFDVLEADTGTKAMEVAEREKPVLLLLDLMLPEKDGFSVLEDIRKNPEGPLAQIPVIVLSNLWSDKDILRTQALKIDGYFVKANTTMAEVMGKVKEVLQNHKG